jgi:hypothetical protein
MDGVAVDGGQCGSVGKVARVAMACAWPVANPSQQLGQADSRLFAGDFDQTVNACQAAVRHGAPSCTKS